MYYSDEVIDQVRSANDIVDVIGQSVPLKRGGSNYIGLCPFHNEKSPSFSGSFRKRWYISAIGCHSGFFKKRRNAIMLTQSGMPGRIFPAPVESNGS